MNSPHEQQQQRRGLTQKSRTVTPELSDVSEAPPSSSITSSTTTATTTVLTATPSMCIYCFDVLIHELLHYRYPLVASQRSMFIPPELFPDDHQDDGVIIPECPLFITWDKQKKSHSSHSTSSHSSHSFELRGCIGTLQPKPMTATTFSEYALTAACKDRRFCKITWPEVSSLRVAVSLLIQFEECQHCTDWTVGIHGIVIRFAQVVVPPILPLRQTNNNNNNHTSTTTTTTSSEPEYSATYLPEVAPEQGWDQMATVKSLIRKAGYKGVVDAALLQRIHCTRYQSSKTHMTYADYVQATNHYDPVQLVQQAFGGNTSNGGGAGGSRDHHDHSSPSPHWNTCNNL
jgi:uncharacterized protein (TIGR00296 family)